MLPIYYWKFLEDNDHLSFSDPKLFFKDSALLTLASTVCISILINSASPVNFEYST